MKHIVGLVLLILIMFTMTGCNINPGASYGKLVEINFVDEEGNEIDGSAYPNQSCNYDEEANDLREELSPLNSPAPGNYYFCITIPEDTNLTVRFMIVAGTGYQFYSIDLGETTISFENVVASVVSYRLQVDYVLSKDLIQEGFFPVSNLKMAIHLEDETSIRSGTTKPHAVNRIAGIVIRFIQEEQTFSGWNSPLGC